MELCHSLGMSTSSLADHDSRIASIGHPMQLDDALSKVLNSVWHTGDETKISMRSGSPKIYAAVALSTIGEAIV
ncbi:hypothetical protein ACVI1L_004771 [Bradyrhizobium sp. USDA 4516]